MCKKSFTPSKIKKKGIHWSLSIIIKTTLTIILVYFRSSKPFLRIKSIYNQNDFIFQNRTDDYQNTDSQIRV